MAGSLIGLLLKFGTCMYGLMTEELVIREIRIDEAAGPGDSDSRRVIMPLKLKSTMKALL